MLEYANSFTGGSEKEENHMKKLALILFILLILLVCSGCGQQDIRPDLSKIKTDLETVIQNQEEDKKKDSKIQQLEAEVKELKENQVINSDATNYDTSSASKDSDLLSIIFWSDGKQYKSRTQLYSDHLCSQKISSDTIIISPIVLENLRLENEHRIYIAYAQGGNLVYATGGIWLDEIKKESN